MAVWFCPVVDLAAVWLGVLLTDRAPSKSPAPRRSALDINIRAGPKLAGSGPYIQLDSCHISREAYKYRVGREPGEPGFL